MICSLNAYASLDFLLLMDFEIFSIYFFTLNILQKATLYISPVPINKSVFRVCLEMELLGLGCHYLHNGNSR